MLTYIKNNATILPLTWGVPFLFSGIIPIALALLCLALVPWDVHNLYSLHAIVTSLVVILHSLLCRLFSVKYRMVLFGLLLIALMEIVSYQIVVYQTSGSFLKPFPMKFLTVQPNKYQAMRTYPLTLDYFHLKKLGFLYAITGSYLQEDFCPSLRQDIVSKSVQKLFYLRASLRNSSNALTRESVPFLLQDYTDNMLGGPENDKALRRTLGCNTPKLRLIANVQYAITEAAATRLVASKDIFKNPVISNSSQGHNAQKPAEELPSHNITVEHFSPNELFLSVENTGENKRWLIYSDAYNPHWKATVDGIPTDISPANIAFKAVPVGPGHHTVRFIFDRPITLFVIFGIVMILLACGTLYAIGWPLILCSYKMVRCCLSQSPINPMSTPIQKPTPRTDYNIKKP